MLNVIMLNFIMLNFIMLNVIMLNVIMLNVIMLTVIMVIVVAPFIKLSSVFGIGLNGRVFGVETRKGSKHFVSLFR